MLLFGLLKKKFKMIVEQGYSNGLFIIEISKECRLVKLGQFEQEL